MVGRLERRRPVCVKLCCIALDDQQRRTALAARGIVDFDRFAVDLGSPRKFVLDSRGSRLLMRFVIVIAETEL